MSEPEYSLAKSKKALGPLYPILKDKFGNIIDGFHRQNDDPDWEPLTRDQIDTPVKLELARLAANFCRRQMPAVEIENRIAFLVKNGLKVAEIAEQTGISEGTIYRHMPQELKDARKVEAGKISGSVRTCEQTVKTYENTQKHECNFCHVTNGEAKEWNGHYLCKQDYARALDDPAKYHRFFDLLKHGKEVMEQKRNEPSKPQSPMQMTRYGDRVEMMKVQHSAEELEFVKELTLLGISPVTNEPICLWDTTPDAKYPSQKVAVYYHGSVHDKGKAMDRDDAIEAALKQQGWDVLIFRHGVGTVKEWAQEVKESLKF